MNKSNIEEIIAVLWFILAAHLPSGMGQRLAIAFGASSMVFSFVYLFQEK